MAVNLIRFIDQIVEPFLQGLTFHVKALHALHLGIQFLFSAKRHRLPFYAAAGDAFDKIFLKRQEYNHWNYS